MSGTWIKINDPDWHCEARGTGCTKPATWEEDRTPEQIRDRYLPELRCDDHLPSDAVKITQETEPQTEVA